MVYLFYIPVFLVTMLFFRKTLGLKIIKNKIIIGYKKSFLISRIVSVFIFNIFIYNYFFITNSYSGLTLLFSVPFSILLLFPLIKLLNLMINDEIISINNITNIIIISSKE